MGLSGISPMSLVLILIIVLVLFGGKRIKSLGEDLGATIRNFRKGLEGKSETKDPSSEEK